MGTLKSDNSCSSLQPATSVSESNSMVTSSGFDINNISPSSLKFNGLKFDVDIDVEVPSPTSLIRESLFVDQLDSGVDFMISSPKRIPDLMISSPNRSSSMATILGYNQNHNYFQAMREQNLPGGSPPSCNSSHVGAFSTPNKGKAQSPLHRDSFGAYPIMKLSGVKCSLETNETPTLPVTLNCHTSTKSSRPCGTVNEVATLGGSQHAQESNLCQMDSFATSPLAQQQQQQQLQQLQLSFSAEPEQEQDSGLQLVQLLLAGAEAIDKEDYMSAKRFLHHLYKVVTPIGNSMQRVAACFTDALCARLAATVTQNPTASSQKTFPSFPPNSVDILKVYQILYQACPYIKFGHFTANQTIFEAFEGEDRVHVVDLDILQGYQWPAFMQALAARPGGAPFLRITGVGCPPESVRETGRCLTELAHSLHLQFEFHPVGEGLKDLKPHMFHRHIGEALAVNSVNRLHHVPSDYLWNLLGIIQDQEPNVVTIVEQEANHNSPYFLSRFLEALHYYSAIFDSLDVTLPSDSAERAKVEQYFFAPEIRNIVACEGPERVERHERLEKWRKMMEERGFKGVPLSANAVTQSKILLGLYSCDGYRLTEDGGCLLLGWQDRAVIAASAWTCC